MFKSGLLFFFTLKIYAGAISFQDYQESLQILPFNEQVVTTPTTETSPFDLRLIQGVDSLIGGANTCATEVMASAYRSRTETNDESSQKDTWLQNSGVVASYQMQLQESPCLSILYHEFYKKIEEDTPSHATYGDGTVNGRPALNSSAGQGPYKNIPPNHFQDMAMQITQGDPQLAMEMIGYCGHDDQNQNASTSINLNSSSRDVILNYMKRAAANEANLVGNGLAEDMFNISHQEEIQRVRERSEVGLAIDCPNHSSPFYAPGAIHSDLKLDTETVNKIASLQAPTKGAGVLPAKNYHMNFAATVGCRLSKCGLSEDQTSNLLTYLAKKYRQKRLKDSQKKYMKWHGLIIREFGLSGWEDPKISEPGFSDKIDEWIARDKKKIIEIAGGELFSSNRAQINWDMLRKNIGAAKSYNKHLSNMYLDDQDKYEAFKKDAIQNYCIGHYKSQERCDEIWNTLDTWMVDFEWTQKQQDLGARFGHKKCSQTPDQDPSSMEERACAVLNQRHVQYRCSF